MLDLHHGSCIHTSYWSCWEYSWTYESRSSTINTGTLPQTWRLSSYLSKHRRPQRDIVRLTECSFSPAQKTRTFETMLFQCWDGVRDGGPTLKQHWVIVSRVLGSDWLSAQISSGWPLFVAFDDVISQHVTTSATTCSELIQIGPHSIEKRIIYQTTMDSKSVHNSRMLFV